MLELCYPQDALPAAREILDQATDEETICACLHVLGHFRDPREPGARAPPHGPPGVERSNPRRHRDRRHRELDDWPAIARRLSDPEWWVRYRAAQALAGLPGMNTRRLLELRDQQTDRFARDIPGSLLAESALR